MGKELEKIFCETPTPGKKPTRIDKWKYDLLANIILEVVPPNGEGLPFKDLPDLVADRIDTDRKSELGSIGWHTTTVKLDLECKNKIYRVPNSSPQRLLLVDSRDK